MTIEQNTISGQTFHAVVKNTFIELKEEAGIDGPRSPLRRQYSDSDLVRTDSSWSRLSFEWAEEKLARDKDTSGYSTCSTPPAVERRPRKTASSEDVSSEEDSELVRSETVAWREAGAEELRPASRAASSSEASASTAPTPMPKRVHPPPGVSQAAAQQAVAIACAAAEAHRKRLASGEERLDDLFCPRPDAAAPECPQAMMVVFAYEIPAQARPFCHACGQQKRDLHSPFCAYCGETLV